MTDPVLTDDEKDALLDGMSSGEIEVHSNNGPGFASVAEFEVGPRSRIETNSFPRLQSLNRQFAGRMGKQLEVLLNAECVVTFNTVARCTYTEVCERLAGLALVVEYSAEPLRGSGLMHLDADFVETLVETFYGGTGNDPVQQGADFFTPGETNVATLFCKTALATLADVWQPLESLSLEVAQCHLNSGVIDSIDGSDEVVVSDFAVQVGAKTEQLYIVWPLRTVAPLVPVFEGQKRERDIAQDAMWARSLRTRLVDSVVKISSGVGDTRTTLRDVAAWDSGDIIPISNPQNGTVSSSRVPILAGKFGVHDGRYAIEATAWLENDISQNSQGTR